MEGALGVENDRNPDGFRFSVEENGPLFVAHKNGDREEPLRSHLLKTAHLAKGFAGAFGAGELGYLMGLAHDIGKYSACFQRRIRFGGPRVDHSTAGAKELSSLGLIEAALCVAGHHGGLPEEGRPGDLEDKPSLWGRMKRELPDYSAFSEEVSLSPAARPVFETEFERMFFVRMLFSALTDADFLATEEFYCDGKTRRDEYDSIPSLLGAFEGYAVKRGWDTPQSPIDRMRRGVLTRCREAAKGKQGFYSLTAPTGSGKTAASLAFALHHAAKWGLNRIIYVIPYTSSIEQTAGVFREILGNKNVLEHHGSTSFDQEGGEVEERLRLSAENWDAPVIVTTSLRFFESLYSDKPSRCRKLHNIAKSVVVLDEVQLLPLPCLRLCGEAMEALMKGYGVTALFCTATQPSLKGFLKEGIIPREICPHFEKYHRDCRRVKLRDIGGKALCPSPGR